MNDNVPLTRKLGLKYKHRMFQLPLDCDKLTPNGLIDTGTLSCAIPETDLRKIRLVATKSIVKDGATPNF